MSKKNMNILMISPFDIFVKRLWGPTLRLHSLAKELIKQGHQVLLVGPSPLEGDTPSILDNVPIHYFKSIYYRYPYSNYETMLIREKKNRKILLPIICISRSLELISLISKYKIDILYVNRAFLETAYPAFAAHLIKKIPIIYDWDDLEGLHGFSTSNKLSLKRQLFETFNETIFARFADAVVVASNHLKKFALNIGVEEDKIFYAPTVADSEIFNPNIDGSIIRNKYNLQRRKILLYCGNLMENNGVKVENILYTLKHLVQKDSTFFLLVVGDGDLLKKEGKNGRLIEIAETLGIVDNVIFLGGIPYTDVPHYISAADLCLALFPVNMITFCKSPLKVYEYMSAGKPVIARDVGELSLCVIDGKTGILVYSDNPEEYASKILESFSKSGALEEMGKSARQIIDGKFLWKHSAKEVIKTCEKTIGKCCSQE